MKRAAMFLLLAAAGAASADDWTRWRGPDGNGVSKETGWKHESLKGRPRVKWALNVGAGHCSVVVSGDRLYTMGNLGGKDLVTCLDVAKGKPLWRYAYACPPGGFPGPRATPVLDDDRLYTLSQQGHALCLGTEKGRVRWQHDLIRDFGAMKLDYGLTGSPLVVGKAVLYNACGGGIALDKSDGKPVWFSDKSPGGYASPVRLVLNGTDHAAIFTRASLVIVNAATGKKTASTGWSTKFDVNAADPLPFDGKLFITSGWGRGGALLDLSGGGIRTVWKSTSLSGQFASPVHIDGHIYGVDGEEGRGRLCCIDAKTGRSTWTHGKGIENLSAAGDRLLVIDNTGALTVVKADPTAYRELARAAVLPKGRNWTAPVLANGRIYCRSGKGLLVCIDAR